MTGERPESARRARLARVPAKVPSLNAPAVTQTWWCEPLLMPRRSRWCRSFSSSLSYYDGCVALAARPICCRACATISVPTLIVASTRRARSTRAGARTARKSRSASPLRQVIPPPRPDLRAFLDFIQAIDATSIDRTRSCPHLLTIVGFRDVWSPGLVFPVLCRDAETEAGAFHQRPAVRGQLGLRRRRSLQFQSSPQMGTGSV